MRLLSPQHWAQELRRQRKGAAHSTTSDKDVTLRAKDFIKTIPLDTSTNVATCRTAPGYSKFVAFCAEAGLNEEDPAVTAAETILIPPKDRATNEEESDEGYYDSNICKPHHGVMQPSSNEVQESFKKLQAMAREGVIPRRLSRCRHPICAAGMFGKAIRRPWRQKTPNNKDEAFQPTKPGEIVSVDQLKSPTPGLIAQITGTLTTKRYEYVTVFVDNFSGYGFVHLQQTSSGEETLKAKEAFERLCKANGIQVLHYHADNGIFKAHAWVNSCQRNGQGLFFAGVNAHHQNGRAEARIRRLQELTRTQLSHAKRLWPQEVSINLWPYAMRLANESINATPNLNDRPQNRSPQDCSSRLRFLPIQDTGSNLDVQFTSWTAGYRQASHSISGTFNEQKWDYT